MSRAYSSAAKAEFNALSGDAPLVCLEITHSALVTPVRVVNDTVDLAPGPGGATFTALGFRVTLPDDAEGRVPKARISIDNIGRELTQWLEAAAGGEGSEVRIMQVMRAAPTVVEWEITMELTNVNVDTWQVSGELGFDDLLGKPAVLLTYRPETTPGVF